VTQVWWQQGISSFIPFNKPSSDRRSWESINRARDWVSVRCRTQKLPRNANCELRLLLELAAEQRTRRLASSAPSPAREGARAAGVKRITDSRLHRMNPFHMLLPVQSVTRYKARNKRKGTIWPTHYIQQLIDLRHKARCGLPSYAAQMHRFTFTSDQP